MAKEQKAIAKLLDKDGITVDFWRFPIKNVDKIIGQVLEMVGKSRLGLSKDDLKNFDTFVIQTTEPNGTVIDTVFECSDVEFLDLVKADYKDYFGYYPSEDKFDSEKWSYILSGHKGYKESNKSSRKSIKESRSSILDDEFYDLVEQGYIYDEDENGMNMSYGEYAAVSDDLWEVLADELNRYRDFPSAYDAYEEIMNNTGDDAKMFMGVSDDDYFYFSIDEDEGTYTFSGEVPSVLEKSFKKFQKETDLERV